VRIRIGIPRLWTLVGLRSFGSYHARADAGQSQATGPPQKKTSDMCESRSSLKGEKSVESSLPCVDERLRSRFVGLVRAVFVPFLPGKIKLTLGAVSTGLTETGISRVTLGPTVCPGQGIF
jgi:hypothetical protein